MVTSHRVAFLSNYKTVNLGNEALTCVLQRTLAARYAPTDVVGFHRLPELYNASIPDPENGTDWNTFVQRELEAAREPSLRPAAGAEGVAFELPGKQLAGEAHSRRRAVLHWLRWSTPLRAAGTIRARHAARAQLAALLAGDAVIYNPAGEINSSGRPTSRFLELAVAQAAGRPTAMINFSFEPDRVISAAARHVLPKVDRIIVRDEESLTVLIEHGALADRIEVVPDGVFLVDRPRDPRPRASKPTIAIVANGDIESADLDQWSELVRRLSKDGYGVEFTSNGFGRDYLFGEQLAAATNGSLTVAPNPASLDAYVRDLSRYSALVTSRLHSAVLAAVAGVPFVAVESNSFKVSGALKVAGFQDRCLEMTEGWPSVAVDMVAGAAPIEREHVDAVRARIDEGFRRVFPL